MADNYLERKMEDLHKGGSRRPAASAKSGNLKALRILVTGGAGLIGSEIVRAFRREGASVDFLDTNSERGEKIAYETGARFHNVDISDADALNNTLDLIINSRGDVEVVVNCAAIVDFVPLEDNSGQLFMKSLQTNVMPAFIIARKLAVTRGELPFDNPYGGRIINICSTRAHQSEAGTENYSASKGALLSLSHALMMSLANLGITVNTISPGWIAAPDENLTDADHSQHPSRRVGRPADIARACLYLAAPANNFINGAEIVVDGGMTHKMIYV